MVAQSTQKLLAVDPSLTCSGWALFDVKSGALCGVGSVTTLGPEVSMPRRLKRLQDNIEAVFTQAGLKAGDILICEDATSMKDPTSVAKLERVRGIFETLARSKDIEVPCRIHPRTVQYELLGLRGKQVGRDAVKQAARGIVVHLFKEALQKIHFDVSENHLKKTQDIVDALLVGSIALSRIDEARRASQPLDECLSSSSSARPSARLVGV